MEQIEKAFARIGARVKLRQGTLQPWETEPTGIRVDVRRDDQRREFFDIVLYNGSRPEVVDTRPGMRHLVMMVREAKKAKYLCGHDERHWFVAAIPGRSVSTVETAIRSLRPFGAVPESVRRQGEWFFRRLTSLQVEQLIGPNPVVHRNEPISRGAGSKPHVCRQVVRFGGTAVMVCNRYPAGISPAEHQKLVDRNPQAAGWGWRSMMLDARVFARGSVRHADHATVYLADWHEVYLNNERKAVHARSVAFLD